MKIMSIVHKLLFFKTTDLCTLDKKVWENVLSSYERKKFWICRQLKYYQLRIKSEIGILLEIIRHAFKCLTVPLSTEILILTIALLSFISLSILWTCYAVRCVTFYCSLRKKTSTLLPEGTDVHIWKHIYQPFTCIMLACLGNT